MKKKLLSVVLSTAMVSTVFAGCGSESSESVAETTAAGSVEATTEETVAETTVETTEAAETTAATPSKVALVTDVGTIDDESFNQACWEGVEEFCDENGIEYQYYQPTADSNDARVASIAQAAADGYDVIVMPGYLFGEAVISVQDTFPDVYFIAVDVASGDLTSDYVTYYEPAENTVCLTFAEEQAGYLAGYAAVKDGYTQLGFLGGMAVPAVIRYGYGFVQGADAAATELETPISINYTYGGQFNGDASITAKMEGWYTNGTEIVFACGGGIYTSAVEAATENDGKVIGVDVDQNPVGASYDVNPFVTSAMKGLQSTTVTVLEDLFAGNWSNYGGQIINYDLAAGDYLGLPTAEESWNFNNFTVEEYETVKNAIASGEIEVANDTEVAVTSFNSDYTTVNEIE